VLAERSGATIWLKSEYHQVELVKQVPGVKWHKDHRLWHLPLSWAACVILRGVFGDELEIGPALTEWATQEKASRVDPCLSLRDAEDADLGEYSPPGELELEPRQRAGAAFMAAAQQAANCDGMGSGKTIQTIVALELLARRGRAPYPALIVCPNSMKTVWAREFATWAPGRTVEVAGGGAQKRNKVFGRLGEDLDVAIVNWESLRAHTRTAGYGMIKLTDAEKEDKVLNELDLHTFVADEAHRAKNPKAKQTRAAWAVAWKCEHRFALTGTPLANTPSDTWSIMHMLEPNEWPSKSQFLDRFALLSWSAFGFMDVVGIRGDTKDEFFRILDPRFIRRPTQVVVPDLLPKLPPQVRFVDLLPKQRKAYDQLRKDLLAELDSGVLMATNPLTRMTRLIQLAAAYGELDEGGKMTLAEPSAKLDALDDVLEELGTEEPVVVFAESRQLVELAAGRLTKQKVPHGLITGAVDTAVRQKSVDEFQAGKLRVILATLGAGGEGLTLTAARYGVRLQRSFSMVKELQAEDRIWRKGQERQVQWIDIVAKDTIEDRVAEIGDEKRGRLEEICRDEDTLRGWLAK
jgi:SNF2 family DNA or RNA helicase